MYLEDARRSVSLSDTVGFIRDLPHTLVDAFQATLQEAADADLLLHVVDAASPVWLDQIREVQRVLHEIGADDVAQVLVFNKMDAMEPGQLPRVPGDLYELAPRAGGAALVRQCPHRRGPGGIASGHRRSGPEPGPPRDPGPLRSPFRP